MKVAEGVLVELTPFSWTVKESEVAVVGLLYNIDTKKVVPPDPMAVTFRLITVEDTLAIATVDVLEEMV